MDPDHAGPAASLGRTPTLWFGVGVRGVRLGSGSGEGNDGVTRCRVGMSWPGRNVEIEEEAVLFDFLAWERLLNVLQFHSVYLNVRLKIV